MTIDPKDLNAEERAIWDALAAREFPNSGARHAYGKTRGAMECMITARRALFGEQEKEEAVATKKHLDCGCVLCTCEDETQCHGCGAKCCDAHRQQQRPATPPAPVAKCPVCKNEPGSRPLTGDCYCEAAPVASELPEAVLDAVYWLMRVGEGFEYDDNNLRLKATALEAWARSQQEVPVEAIRYAVATVRACTSKSVLADAIDRWLAGRG